VSGYSAALQKINSLHRNKKFQKFLQQQSKLANGHELAALMITPVQRIGRYHLLLRELLNCTEKGDDASPDTTQQQLACDYASLESAYEIAQQIAMHVNDESKRIENKSKLLEIQSKITNSELELFVPHRRFICELSNVEFKMTQSKYNVNSTTSTFKHVFLFNDILLWTNSQFEYISHIELDDCQSEIYDDDATVQSQKQYGIIVKRRNSASQPSIESTSSCSKRCELNFSFIISTINESERDKLYKSLSNCLSELDKSRNERLEVMIKKNEAPSRPQPQERAENNNNNNNNSEDSSCQSRRGTIRGDSHIRRSSISQKLPFASPQSDSEVATDLTYPAKQLFALMQKAPLQHAASSSGVTSQLHGASPTQRRPSLHSRLVENNAPDNKGSPSQSTRSSQMAGANQTPLKRITPPSETRSRASSDGSIETPFAPTKEHKARMAALIVQMRLRSPVQALSNNTG
jgi:hypothetical protein